jgi:hypothetical protein
MVSDISSEFSNNNLRFNINVFSFNSLSINVSGSEGDMAFHEVLLRVEQSIEFNRLSQILFIELSFNSVKLEGIFINNKAVSSSDRGFNISISTSEEKSEGLSVFKDTLSSGFKDIGGISQDATRVAVTSGGVFTVDGVFLAGNSESSFSFEVTIVEIVQESGVGVIKRSDGTETFVISADFNEDVKVKVVSLGDQGDSSGVDRRVRITFNVFNLEGQFIRFVDNVVSGGISVSVSSVGELRNLFTSGLLDNFNSLSGLEVNEIDTDKSIGAIVSDSDSEIEIIMNKVKVIPFLISGVLFVEESVLVEDFEGKSQISRFVEFAVVQKEKTNVFKLSLRILSVDGVGSDVLDEAVGGKSQSKEDGREK